MKKATLADRIEEHIKRGAKRLEIPPRSALMQSAGGELYWLNYGGWTMPLTEEMPEEPLKLDLTTRNQQVQNEAMREVGIEPDGKELF